jgi:hypothetical protein
LDRIGPDWLGLRPELPEPSRVAHFQLSRNDPTTTRQKQKTHGRFFGAIFLEAPRICKMLPEMNLQRKKQLKSEKSQNNKFFLWREAP